MTSTAGNRITVQLKNPNPLFEQWLTEWRDKAIETDSKMQHCFGKALQSLQKYPLPLESGRDCRILQGFGSKLCEMLDKKLADHKMKNPSANPTIADIADHGIEHSKPNIKRTPNRRKTANQNLNANKSAGGYVPARRSGAYAVLITLYKDSLKANYPGYMLKTDIIRNGQHLCDKSFLKPDPGSYYTAWSSMKTLLDKNLVVKHSSPAKFSLTAEGLVLAHKLYRDILNNDENDIMHSTESNEQKPDSQVCVTNTELTLNRKDTNNKTAQGNIPLNVDCQTDTESTCSSSASQYETYILTPHSFEIILLVDKQETAGATRNPLDDATLAELSHLNIRYEVRHLNVGDYTWICRQQGAKNELVLPYIIERKRMDDFGSSIKDGRFHEQKFRLKQCGIQNVIYLIESHGNNTHTGLPLATLYQAATNTLLQDGFSLKFTDTLRDTIEYLASFTSLLKNIFENKTLVSCPKQNLGQSRIQDDLVSLMSFQEFNKGASKTRNFNVQELFVRHLLQLKGMSVEKALAIVDKYPTPQLLHGAYNNRPENGEKLLSTVQYGKLRKKIGPVISKAIYQLYTCEQF